jgi:hypothetical protein
VTSDEEKSLESTKTVSSDTEENSESGRDVSEEAKNFKWKPRMLQESENVA